MIETEFIQLNFNCETTAFQRRETVPEAKSAVLLSINSKNLFPAETSAAAALSFSSKKAEM